MLDALLDVTVKATDHKILLHHKDARSDVAVKKGVTKSASQQGDEILLEFEPHLPSPKHILHAELEGPQIVEKATELAQEYQKTAHQVLRELGVESKDAQQGIGITFSRVELAHKLEPLMVANDDERVDMLRQGGAEERAHLHDAGASVRHIGWAAEKDRAVGRGRCR